MAKRRIRTKDQLPRAQTREVKIAAKQADLRNRYIGVDLGTAEAAAIAMLRNDGERQTFMGMEVITNPLMPEGSMHLLNQQDVVDAVKDAIRSYDFRQPHRG